MVKLLREHQLTSTTKCVPGSGGVARRAADAVTNLAHENVEIKNTVREVGGVPPLVALLEAMDHKVGVWEGWWMDVYQGQWVAFPIAHSRTAGVHGWIVGRLLSRGWCTTLAVLMV